MVFSLLLLLCSPRYETLAGCRMTCYSETIMAVGPSPVLGLKCFVSRRTEKKKQRKHHPLAQLIKVINTLAILFIVIPELTKFRTTKCLGHLLCFSGHLNIVRVPLVHWALSRMGVHFYSFERHSGSR